MWSIGLVDGLDHFDDVGFLADIGIIGSRFPALLFDLFAQLLGAIALGKVIDGDFCASCG